MKVCIAGKNDIAVNAAKWLVNDFGLSTEQLCLLGNATDDGKDGFQHSLKKYARETGILESTLDTLYQIEELLFISLEFDQLIKPECFKSKRLFNIHFSLLPKYRGMYTSAWPILNGETESGVTLHEIDSGIDTGNIIKQVSFTISERDTARDLYMKYIEHGTQLFKDCFATLLEGNYSSHAQDETQASYFSKSSIDYQNLDIKLAQPAIAIQRAVRAFNFKEYQTPEICHYPVVACEILAQNSELQPGTVILDEERFFRVATLDKNIELVKERL